MESKRLAQLPPYLFVEIDRLKDNYRRAGRTILDLGIGDPDLGAPPELVDAFRTALERPPHHRYPPDRGLPELLDSIRKWSHRFYHTPLEREEILVTIGSKEAIGHLPLAVVNPGEIVLVPDPGYPVYYSSVLFAGAVSRRFPLQESNGYWPHFSAIDSGTLGHARLMFLNYPNNPTSALSDSDRFREAIECCREHQIILVNDAAYSEITYDQPTTPLFPIAKEAGIPYIEFFSFSKTFSITGWRVGFAIGSVDVVRALAKIKSNLDSGVFGAIQEAVAFTLDHHFTAITTRTRSIYRERRNILVESLNRSGLSFTVPPATFYFWIRTPGGMKSIDFCRLLLEEIGIVATPGIGFGEHGEGYFRLSITNETENIQEAGRKLEELSSTLRYM